jgi:hypothetical protein
VPSARWTRRLALACAGLALAGCSIGPVHVHRGADARDHLEFLVRALGADAAGREAMWQTTLKLPVSEAATLHRALLRSVPGHSGYDVAAAEAELQALLSQSPSADVAPVARARLEDLRATAGCRYEVENLKRRLSKVADIERRLDSERREGKEKLQ